MDYTESKAMLNKLQQQIDDLQSRVAYQEDMLQSLNNTIAYQDKVIIQLHQQLQAQRNKLEDIAFGIESTASEKPPHY